MNNLEKLYVDFIWGNHVVRGATAPSSRSRDENTIQCPICQENMDEDDKGYYRCKCGWVLVFDPLEEMNNNKSNPDLIHLTEKLSNILSLSPKARDVGIQLISFAKKHFLHLGRHPHGIVAASLYIATRITREPLTQKELAKAAHISKLTIRNRYKEILRLMSNGFPESLYMNGREG